MGCCIALALVISVLRTGWFRLVRRQAPPRVGFAPPARRPAPMATGVDPAGTGVDPADTRTGTRHGLARTTAATGTAAAAPAPVPSRAAGAITRTRRQLGAAAAVVALSAVIGVGLYSELLDALVRADLVTVAGPGAAWRIRELVLIAGGVAAALVAVAAGLHRVPPARRRRRAVLALAGGGGAWSLLSVIDMHLTGLVPEGLVDPLTDLALHGPGFLAATTGVGALLAGDRWMNSLSPTTTRGTS